jgi:hypothetical protein
MDYLNSKQTTHHHTTHHHMLQTALISRCNPDQNMVLRVEKTRLADAKEAE